MPELTLDRLDMHRRHLALLRELLQLHLPQAEAWAYGSRVNGTGHEASDLDLVIRQPADPKQETPQLPAIREALVESNLPIRVDVVDWARIPDTFHREIERAYVVVQDGGGQEDGARSGRL